MSSGAGTVHFGSLTEYYRPLASLVLARTWFNVAVSELAKLAGRVVCETEGLRCKSFRQRHKQDGTALPFRYHGGINLVIPSYSVLVQWTCALRMALRLPGCSGMWSQTTMA